ncbi:NAD(P)H-dependent glycerol-3-phosphate dehydrogenase [Mycoplasmopsis gallinarum]|uniref:Glycerol-3-phosphate dehydrogenase n=1 Tax=Mycoplasmopsis gallinarum TaxID=29557 RepID=A0A168RLR2_9BACT|nr:NAD(P)H-dependent glycerol-3-phosphate dehydrogenase [Mycoplasmopsis gallinarum]OAB49101.1 Glycerol-3-phosphate dehydrogenase [NAD (P) ] [Mycoplasmopsis gallinarum]
MQKRITFIGTGAWASGLATVLTKNNHFVTMWGIDQKEIDDINNGLNTKYFGNSKFNNPNLLQATNDLKKALEGTDLIVLAVPSAAFDSVIPKILENSDSKKLNILNVAKGIDSKTKKFFSEVIKKEFGNRLENCATLIGPSFAVEVFQNVMTMANIVGINQIFLEWVAALFNNNKFKLVINTNEQGAELFAALKNVLAIGLGINQYSNPNLKNPQAALLSIGVKEINKIYKALFEKADDEIAFDLAGIGDIFLTCSSEKSRNFSFGLQVGEYGVRKALEMNTKTVEGYRTANIFKSILKDLKIHVPFFENIIDVLFNNKPQSELLDFINKY